ncbi:MAG: hypothetical protein JRE12_16015 [Deltaproteobacteria bacterium]|nr:hypothetical protein [Deltaproteobacteria bacterium]
MFLKKVLDLRHTLAFRLTLWYASIFTLSACIAFLIFYFVISALFQERTDKDLLKQVGVFTAMLNADGVEAVKRLAAQEVQASGEKKVFFRLLYPTGISFSSSNMSFWRDIGVTHHRYSSEKTARAHHLQRYRLRHHPSVGIFDGKCNRVFPGLPEGVHSGHARPDYCVGRCWLVHGP